MTLSASLAALRLHVGTFADSPEFRQIEDAIDRIATQSLWQEMERRMFVLAAENASLRNELKATKEGKRK